ncbi:MAG: hypothetical protein WCL07_00120 [bacterium]
MKKYLIFLLATIIAYGGSLHYGFSQDDWYFLFISKANSVKDVLLFFSPWNQQGFPFYRPLSTQLYYFLATSIAGLSGAPIAMHVFMILLLSIAGFILYLLARQLKFSLLSSTLVGLLYVGSSVHFLSLYYIAATQQLLSGTLMLFALYWVKTKNAQWPAYLAFVLALLCKENAILLPAYLLLLSDWSIIKIRSLMCNLKSLLPYIFIALIYLTLRLTSRVEVQSEYQPVFGLRALGTFKIYLSFLFGYYEKIQDYVLPSGIRQYLIDTRPFGYLTVAGSLISASTIGYLTINSLLRRQFVKLQLQYLLMFTIGLSPWLLLPDHIFPHYLDLPMAALALLLISLCRSQIVAIILTISLLVANYGGIKSSEILHWTVLRSRLNTAAIPQLINRGLCQSNAIVLSGDNLLAKELSYSLSMSNGPRVLCNNSILQVYYGETNINEGKIINIEGVRQ